MSALSSEGKAKLIVRRAATADVPGIVDLSVRTYGDDWGYTPEMVIGHLSHFPEGQFVAEYEGRIVGYCATFLVTEQVALSPHRWREITGGGFASRHDPKGEWLYGMEVCVDPEFQGLRMGRRLYEARKDLCMRKGLRGIVFGGRLPGFGRRAKKYDGKVEAYVEDVVGGRVRDRSLTFQLNNGFELIGVLRDYLPSDKESLGHAAHLVWRNPTIDPNPLAHHVVPSGVERDTVRIATIQYQQRKVKSFEEFETQVDYFLEVASDYRADFALLPELFTLQLLSIENEPLSPAKSIYALTDYTGRVKEMLSRLAVKRNLNVIGGSHPTRIDNGEVRNICYIALRDGSIHQQEKIHPTPNERRWWGISGGDVAQAVTTDCGPVGVMICYDSEFPELARHLTDQGARILFIPFCTDERQSYLRVRYCAAARAIENQCYIVMSGNVGNLPGVNNFDIQYAQSCILTPCDFPFARDGIAADTTPNVEMVAFADLHLADLARARNEGTVQNLKDRRHDLYQMTWRPRPGTRRG